MKEKSQYNVILMYPREKISAFYYMMPLGLVSIASVLQQNGITVKILDIITLHHGKLLSTQHKFPKDSLFTKKSPTFIGLCQQSEARHLNRDSINHFMLFQ